MKLVTALMLAAFVCVFASCKKDFVTETSSDSLNGDVTSSNVTANDVLETAPPVATPIIYNVNSNVAGYYRTLPARYSLTTKRYPMILFIHGIGELGTGLNRLNCCGLQYHIKRQEFPAKFLVNGVWHSFIVIAPQFKVRPSAAQIQSVIDFAKSKYRVDPTRVYVAGLSMGGGSTWDYATVYGQNAAAVVPVCAGARPTTTLAASVASKNLPIWSLNSSGDYVVPLQWAKDWISWIDARNTTMAPQTKITIWSGISHNGTWGKAFNPITKVDGYNIYEWMLRYKRGSAPAPAPTPEPDPTPTPTSGNKAPLANAGADQSIPVSWKYFPQINGSKSTDADGWITSYKWSKVSGPASYTFSSPNTAITKANNLVAGTYVFRVTVTDNKGATAYDDVKITMTGTGTTSPTPTPTTGGNNAPLARAGADQSIPVSWKYFPQINGSTSTDADGWITSYKWSKISGPTSYSFSSPNTAITKANNLVAGTYVFRVTVTDNKGATAYDDVKITMTNN